ncbi:MAG: hypothetical protein IJ846_04805 [Alphaproteobacteria bacterium]|nr:hypothetical protein [Alphaproteobacteria bacterium]
MSVEEKHVAKKMAKALAFMCLNDHFKLPLHSGHNPVSHTGDYTDVVVTDAKGRQMAWNQACRVSYHEREKMMEDVADGIYDFLLNIETETYAKRLEDAYRASVHWKSADALTGRKKRR